MRSLRADPVAPLTLLLLPLAVDARRYASSLKSAPRVVHGVDKALWVRRERADPARHVAFKLTLATAKSEHELDAMVRAVSDVTSPDYGKYVDAEALKAHWAPSDAARAAVQAMLDEYGQDQAIEVAYSAAGDYVTLKMDVATAEKLFETVLFEYEHQEAAHMRITRPLREFALPEHLAPHVVFVDGLESFPTPRQAQLMLKRNQDGDPFAVKSKQVVNNNEILVTPALIRSQYDIPKDRAQLNGSHPANRLVIGAFLNEYYTERDLATFLSTYESGVFPSGFQLPHHEGECLAGYGIRATGEASLDVQVAVSLTRSEDISMLCYQHLRNPARPFADDNQEPFLDFMQAVNAMEPAPSVVSISYTDEECAMPRNYALAVNREFMKAAMKGITIVISAGDAGIQGSHMSEFCGISACSKFVPMFPVSSPYVTAVGATSVNPSATLIDGKYAERVTSTKHGDLITSGGGFSTLFERPSYQDDVITKFLDDTASEGLSSMFNANGRAYPDVAALGHAFPVYQNGAMYPTDGTSVSAPIISSMVVLLNKLRLDQGRPVLGFLNPLIYKLQTQCPHVLQDITDGEISCGGSSTPCCSRGFSARPGWDATSGVGTIKFETLASELDKCIEQIRLADTKFTAFHPINLLQQETSSHWNKLEQLGLITTMVAAVALFGVLITLRRKLFPGDRFFDLRTREPAREYLLAGEHY
ncbi:hypothetical protein Poli38472_009977 [Pythium oligandrum]|uniref:subtilisin n=1 Tax=Pythium oligandrum TaxID=41045 RepID=A0A8K1C918_PYTOL|nr:hypothetical protein Poli38472_009977 [Pythium oligandrum]|eukprot:TMW58418.1 hypothetical protein Poli38472_009977 [Pythium oligandrum]